MILNDVDLVATRHAIYVKVHAPHPKACVACLCVQTISGRCEVVMLLLLQLVVGCVLLLLHAALRANTHC